MWINKSTVCKILPQKLIAAFQKWRKSADAFVGPKQAQHLIKLSNKSSSGLEGGGSRLGDCDSLVFLCFEDEEEQWSASEGNTQRSFIPEPPRGERSSRLVPARFQCGTLTAWELPWWWAATSLSSFSHKQCIFVSMKITFSAVLQLKASTSHLFCFCRVFPWTFLAALCTGQLSLISQRNAKHLSACYHAFKIIYRSGLFFWDSL